MAQTKNVPWAQLRVGLLVLTSLTILAVMVFLMTGEGLFSKRVLLNIFIDNAGGLKKGNPVRLTGLDIGNIEDIHISGDRNPARAVVVVARVHSDYLEEIRQDSVATLEADGLLGQRYVDITRGTPSSPKVTAGGEVKYKLNPGLGDVISNGATALTNMNRLVNSFTRISESIEKGQGSLGKFIYNDELYRNAELAVKDAQFAANYVAQGQGTLGKFIMDEGLYQRTSTTVEKLNGMVDDVRAGKGTLGKLINDPALYDDARRVMTNAEAVVADVRAGKGTLGKMVTDEVFYNRASSALEKIDTIAGRLERGEGSAGRLLKDEALYNNSNQLSLEIRELLADFRKNPKKYLTINFKLF